VGFSSKPRPTLAERNAWRRASIKKSRIQSIDFLAELRFGSQFPWQPHYVAQLTRYITLLFQPATEQKDGSEPGSAPIPKKHPEQQVRPLWPTRCAATTLGGCTVTVTFAG
jgi:hypothetical protein